MKIIGWILYPFQYVIGIILLICVRNYSGEGPYWPIYHGKIKVYPTSITRSDGKIHRMRDLIIDEVNELFEAFDNNFWNKCVFDQNKYPCLDWDVKSYSTMSSRTATELAVWCLQYRIWGDTIRCGDAMDALGLEDIEVLAFRMPLMWYLRALPYKMQLRLANDFVEIMGFDKEHIDGILKYHSNNGFTGALHDAAMLWYNIKEFYWSFLLMTPRKK